MTMVGLESICPNTIHYYTCLQTAVLYFDLIHKIKLSDTATAPFQRTVGLFKKELAKESEMDFFGGYSFCDTKSGLGVGFFFV